MQLTWLEPGSAEQHIAAAEFEERVHRAVGVLRGLGLQPGHRVGVLAGSNPLHVVLHAAGRRLGYAVCPLDARLGEAALLDQMQALGVEILACEAGLAGWADRAPAWDGPVIVGNPDGTDLQGIRGTLHAPAKPGTGTAAILLTSGTTGHPRAIAIPHEALRRHALAANLRLDTGPAPVWLAVLPLIHVGGVALVQRCLDTEGAHLVLHGRFDAADAVAALERHNVTHVSLVPTMLHRLIAGRHAPPPTLMCALVGGDRLDPALAARALGAGWPIYATYGLTEACSQVATATPDELRARPGTSGRPLDGVQITILSEVGQAYGGDEGEIIVSGPTILGGSCRTGDWGRLEDGYLYVAGRRLDRIVTGGENVDPIEVEEVLGGHPDVADACVVGVDDAEWGSRVVAVLVPAGEAPVASNLDEWCRARLAPPQCPRAFLFTERLPRTESGKLQRAVVRRFAAEHALG